MFDSFILHVPPLTHLPASARRCSRRSANEVAKELSAGDSIQPTVAENAFLQVIMVLRKTFIQDLVVMMELHPYYPIWQHSIFSDPTHLSFEA
ncbi:hypothetical protein [Absidia glauca]|uniref:Ndc10 domain-containing protein n=1 Tax=Absidia glauca TaxID=4829 RepID=A0A163MD43_ABSGL|nr:hypothetical protein [Absidia glauca]